MDRTHGKMMAAAVVALAILIAVQVFFGRLQCRWRAEAMGVPHKWGVFTGCMVADTDGKFVPIENYRVIAR